MSKPLSRALHNQEQPLLISSTDSISLETRLFLGNGNKKDTCVLICHPYGPLGN